MKQHNYLWFALETTGLDPTQCAPLEFAAVLCADAMGDDFRIVDRYSVPLHYELQQDDDIDDYVIRSIDFQDLKRKIVNHCYLHQN